MAQEHNVRLLRLPSNLTHLLQPLDKAVFGEVKRQWRKNLRCHSRVSKDKVRKEDFPAKLREVLETSLKSDNVRSGFEATGIFPFNPKRVKQQDAYTPYAEEYAQHQPDLFQSSSIGLAQNTTSPSPQTTTPACPPQCFPLPAASKSQIVQDVESMSGSNVLNIKSIHITTPQLTTPVAPNTEDATTNTSNNIKDFFLKHITPPNKKGSAKKQRVTTMNNGESLTSPEAMARLAQSQKRNEKRKKGKQSNLNGQNNIKRKADRDGQTALQKPRHGRDGDRDGKATDIENIPTEPSLTIESDVYYAVMFTSPPAYYIGRPLNISTPPDGEEYTVKFLNRGPNNTYVRLAQDKIENVPKNSSCANHS